jgi:hypothetical protein
VKWAVDVTDGFAEWWSGLTETEQDDVSATAWLLAEWGPYPRFPHSSWINQSRHRHMREIRIRSGGSPFRLLYAFDPRRVSILVIGGDKGCNNQLYRQHIALADRTYDVHLQTLAVEALQQ